MVNVDTPKSRVINFNGVNPGQSNRFHGVTEMQLQTVAKEKMEPKT